MHTHTQWKQDINFQIDQDPRKYRYCKWHDTDRSPHNFHRIYRLYGKKYVCVCVLLRSPLEINYKPCLSRL